MMSAVIDGKPHVNLVILWFSVPSPFHLEEAAKAVREVGVVDVHAGQTAEKGLQRVACLLPAPLLFLVSPLLLCVDMGTCRDEVIQQHRHAHLQSNVRQRTPASQSACLHNYASAAGNCWDINRS
jgi:hypothetical protein